MRIAIVYHSGSGNTKALMEEIALRLPSADVFRVIDFDVARLASYDALLVGTYTWGNGDMPNKMKPFYEALKAMDISHLKTAVFGTGETGYKYYCGAVDTFRDMLYVHSNLLATLKVEQRYQSSDLSRIEKLCEIFV